MPTFLVLTGMLLVGWSLWEFRRLLRRSDEGLRSYEGSGCRDREKELQRLADQLVASAQEVLAAIDGRTQELEFLLERADAIASKMRANERPQAGNLIPVEVPVEAAAGSSPEPPGSREPSGALWAEPPDKYREVFALAEQGADPKEIARKTSLTTGEVQLILGLKRIG